MRLVDKAEARPHLCVVFPHLGSYQEEGYIDTGNTVTILDGRPYVSVVGVKEMCKVLGFPTPEEHADVVARLEAAEARADDAEARLADADMELDAIHILRGRGYKPAKRPGRPPAKAQTA